MKADEAAALAALILEHGGRELSGDLRARLDGIARGMRWSSLRPWFGSLARDPVHAGSYYLAVDALGSGEPTPLLLRISPAAAPSSGLFPKAALIARLRLDDGREVVLSAAPFGPDDEAAIRTFVQRVDRGFAPRPESAISAAETWAAIRAGARVRG